MEGGEEEEGEKQEVGPDPAQPTPTQLKYDFFSTFLSTYGQI